MDSGARDAGAVTLCAADRECSDGSFCNVLRCVPGHAAADARGCVVTGSPCRAGETCEEATSECVPETRGPVPDRDGDGHDSIACGGNDCDDDELRWDYTTGGAGSDSANAVAVDTAGRALLVGWFEQTVDFGDGSPPPPARDGFVVRLAN